MMNKKLKNKIGKNGLSEIFKDFSESYLKSKEDPCYVLGYFANYIFENYCDSKTFSPYFTLEESQEIAEEIITKCIEALKDKREV